MYGIVADLKGAPLSGICVLLYGEMLIANRPGVWIRGSYSGDASREDVARTDSAGRYEIPIMKPERRRAYPDFTGMEFYDCVEPITFATRFLENSPIIDSNWIYVREDGWMNRVDMRLPEDGRISGKVTDHAGEPVAGAEVVIVDERMRDSDDLGVHTAMTYSLTNSDGSYEVGGLSDADYTVIFEWCDGEDGVGEAYNDRPLNNDWGTDEPCSTIRSYSSSGDPVRVREGDVTRGINASLPPPIPLG